MPNNLLKRFMDFWFAPVDPIRLETFRVTLGLAVFFYVQFRWRHAAEWLTAEGFHVSPKNLPYYDLAVPLLPKALLIWFGVILFGSLIAVIVGWRLQYTLWIAWASVLYVTFADQLSGFVTNKLSCVALLIVTLTSCGGYWTIDNHTTQASKSQRQSVWPIRVLQLTLILCYFLAGWNKAVGEWLQSPFVLWTQIQGTYLTDAGAWMIRVLPLWTWIFFQYNALAFELLAPIHLGIKKLRPYGLIWGVLFQLIVALTMYHLIYFSLVLLSFYVLFLDEKLLHNIHCKWLEWIRGVKRRCVWL